MCTKYSEHDLRNLYAEYFVESSADEKKRIQKKIMKVSRYLNNHSGICTSMCVQMVQIAKLILTK